MSHFENSSLVEFSFGAKACLNCFDMKKNVCTQERAVMFLIDALNNTQIITFNNDYNNNIKLDKTQN